jgi:4-amino-4-deoxy-L-arabinose transferase-like glycosyltransferase
MTLRSGSKKAALLAALFMALSMYAIGFSQEMRSNMLRMFLVPLCAAFFLDFQQRPSPANMILYCLSCICLANTHYFGVIFIAANFIHYFYCFFTAKKTDVKSAVLFVCANVIAALSFLPFFLITALHGALVNTGFNSSIKTPGIPEITLAFVVIVFFIAGIFLWKKKKPQALVEEKASRFTVYLFSVSALVFVLSQAFSLYRPIFKPEYFLSIVYPPGIALSAIFVLAVSKINHVHAKCLAGFCAFLFCVSYYQGIRGDPENGAFKECNEYIARDSAAHPGLKSATFGGTVYGNYSGYPEYYGYNALPVYSAENGFDVLYLPHVPSDIHEDRKKVTMIQHGIDYSNLLKIHVNDETVVYKKYLK